MHHQQLKNQLTISVHQSDSHRFRFGARLSDSVDVLCPDTKLVLPIWEEVLDTNRHFTDPSNGPLTEPCCENTHLYVVGGAVAGHQVFPLLLHGVPDLQFIGLHGATSIVGRPVPRQRQAGPTDV